jgi:hypothetical protein
MMLGTLTSQALSLLLDNYSILIFYLNWGYTALSQATFVLRIWTDLEHLPKLLHMNRRL